jgi:hypothetical protein
MEFVVENLALGRVFLQVLRSFIPIRIQPTTLHSLLVLSSTLYRLDTDGVIK